MGTNDIEAKLGLKGTVTALSEQERKALILDALGAYPVGESTPPKWESVSDDELREYAQKGREALRESLHILLGSPADLMEKE